MSFFEPANKGRKRVGRDEKKGEEVLCCNQPFMLESMRLGLEILLDFQEQSPAPAVYLDGSEVP